MSHSGSSQQLASAGSIPSYNGDPAMDINEWIHLFSLHVISKQLDDTASRLHLLTLLKDEAKVYYELINGDELSIEIVLTSLKTRFENETRRFKLNEIKNLEFRSDQSYACFFEKYIVLARKCNIPEELQLDWITDRLPSSLNTAITTLKIANVQMTTSSILDILRSDTISKSLNTENNQVSAISKTKKRWKKGIKWCKHHKKCNHTTENCRYLNKNNSYHISNLNIYLNNIKKRFTSEVQLNNIRLTALIDSGADCSCIKESVALSLGLKSNKKIVLSMANCSTTQGKLYKNVEVAIFNKNYTVDLVSIKSLSHDMIIGLDVLRPLLKDIPHEQVFQINTLLDYSIEKKFETLMKDSELMSQNTKFQEFEINTGNSQPIQISRYRLGKPIEDKAEEEIKKLLKNGIIRKSSSPWCSPIVVVPKKDNKVRLCVDYRALNKVTLKDSYPLPRIDDILDSLRGSEIFSTLDATSGFYQIPVCQRDIPKTAFQTKSGLYEFLRMPFGLTNAPAAFQRVVDNIFGLEKEKFVQCYLDDIIVYSKNRKDHDYHLSTVYEKLKNAGLILNKEKCRFYRNELDILGYKVKKNSIYPTHERIESIKNFPLPTSYKELKSFLGLISYSRNFIQNLSSIAKPLLDLLKGSPENSQTLKFTETELISFEKLKNLINSDNYLSIADYSKNFIVTTDASKSGISGILAQLNDKNVEVPISFFSKTLTQAQANYSATQLELLAVVETLRHYKHYLLHKKFLLKTDHEALLALNHTKNHNSMLFRWSLELSDFKFDIQHIKGTKNPADILSRLEPKAVNSISSSSHKIIVDIQTQQDLISNYHIYLGHGNAGNVIYNLKQKYQWKGMYSQVHEFVNQCTVCMRAKVLPCKNNFKMIRSSSIGELIEIDCIGPLPCTKRGKKFIITAVDHYSKIGFAKSYASKTSLNVIDFISSCILPKIAKIKTVLSDNGLEFSNRNVLDFCKIKNIKWIYGSPYHPETQGAVEKFNQTFIRKIRKISNFTANAWDYAISKALEAYNASFHRVLGCSPSELFYKKKLYIDCDKKIDIDESQITISKNKIEANLNRVRQKYKSEFEGKYDGPKNLKKGDHVLKYNFLPNLDKLQSRWESGFVIEGVSNCNQSYVLSKLGKKYRANKLHVMLNTSKA